MDDAYTIIREGYEFLVEENGGIAWSRYAADATFYESEEEADKRRLELGLVLCSTGWHSNRTHYKKLMMPPREQRIIPGVVGHPTGGQIYCLLDVLYKMADDYLADEKKKTEVT